MSEEKTVRDFIREGVPVSVRGVQVKSEEHYEDLLSKYGERLRVYISPVEAFTAGAKWVRDAVRRGETTDTHSVRSAAQRYVDRKRQKLN